MGPAVSGASGMRGTCKAGVRSESVAIIIMRKAGENSPRPCCYLASRSEPIGFGCDQRRKERRWLRSTHRTLPSVLAKHAGGIPVSILLGESSNQRGVVPGTEQPVAAEFPVSRAGTVRLISL